MKVLTSAALLVLTFAAAVEAQAVPLSFEVASVKLNKSGPRGPGSSHMEFSPGGERFVATNVGLGILIMTAYDVTSSQISGPEGPLTERYDIEAIASGPESRAGMLRLLQSLLEDRFKLVVRREIKERAAYALIVDRGGPKLHSSGVAHPERLAPRNPYLARGSEPRSGHLVFTDETMADFAWRLSTLVAVGGRIVVDQTGLHDHYDFELQFGSELASASTPGAEGPSIFTAMREQLGLKLEARILPVALFIVEHVERPSGN